MVKLKIDVDLLKPGRVLRAPRGEVNQCLWLVRLIGRGWRSCEAERRDGLR